MKYIDITGKKFNRWTVLARADNTAGGQAQWLCKCDCGNMKILTSVVIRRGMSKSCGCYRLEMESTINLKHGHTSNGVSPTYHSWVNMKSRCNCRTNIGFENYGGRGISVCERWNKFENFLSDMGDKPKGKSLDRIDTNGNYCKENCRWASNKEQGRNKRNNILLTHNGETKTISEWAEITGINRRTLEQRHHNGWSDGKTINTDVRHKSF